MSANPYWYPERTDDAWLARIRADYPERADWDDESLRDHYADGWKYADTWDHVGDAREDYEKLADDYLLLREAAERVVTAMRGYPFYSAALAALEAALAAKDEK